jgi:hypothetical protein
MPNYFTVCFTDSGKQIVVQFEPILALPQRPPKKMLAMKVVKNDSKIIILQTLLKTVKQTVIYII